MDKPDNGYEKDEKGGYRQINNDGGDEIDYLYENGEIVESKEVQTYSGETISGSGIGNKARDYGKIWIEQSPALYDPSFDIATTVLPVGEIKVGYGLVKMGVTRLSKAAYGLRVGLGASKTTLKSSVYFTQKLGVKNKMSLRLPTIMGKPTNNLGVFLGRNSSIIGSALILDGIRRIYNKFQ